MTSITTNIVTYLKTLLNNNIVFDTIGNSENYQIVVSHISFNIDYTNDASMSVIDENIQIHIKRDSFEKLKSVGNTIKTNICSNLIDDNEIFLANCQLLNELNAIQESTKSYVLVLNFRFIGDFK